MTTDLSFIHLITGASFIVQLVMLFLLIVSIASWAVILKKRRELMLARRTLGKFEARFWSGIDLSELYQQVSKRKEGSHAGENIFSAGFKVFLRLHQHDDASPTEVLEDSQRAMRIAMNREIDALEHNLAFLATVGSTSPYIGLFGTVWGIMNSFRALGNVNQATLAMVAPGIAEALIATAMGLFAAIPAVIAYNRYVSDVDRLSNRYGNFVEEFASILKRQSRVKSDEE